MKQNVTEEHLAQVKNHFERMRIGLQQGLQVELAKERIDKDRVNKFKSQLWKVNGYLDEGLSLHLLESVVLTYQKIGMAP